MLLSIIDWDNNATCVHVHRQDWSGRHAMQLSTQRMAYTTRQTIAAAAAAVTTRPTTRSGVDGGEDDVYVSARKSGLFYWAIAVPSVTRCR